MSQNHTNDGLPLPDACAHRVLSYLPAQQILSAAATSRRFANVVKAPELWLEVCKSRWPDVRTSAVVARAVRTRGPMAFYRRRVSCSRELSVPTVPLCDLEDLIFTVDMEQGATHLCSVAIEARDAIGAVLRPEDLAMINKCDLSPLKLCASARNWKYSQEGI